MLFGTRPSGEGRYAGWKGVNFGTQPNKDSILSYIKSEFKKTFKGISYTVRQSHYGCDDVTLNIKDESIMSQEEFDKCKDDRYKSYVEQIIQSCPDLAAYKDSIQRRIDNVFYRDFNVTRGECIKYFEEDPKYYNVPLLIIKPEVIAAKFWIELAWESFSYNNSDVYTDYFDSGIAVTVNPRYKRRNARKKI